MPIFKSPVPCLNKYGTEYCINDLITLIILKLYPSSPQEAIQLSTITLPFTLHQYDHVLYCDWVEFERREEYILWPGHWFCPCPCASALFCPIPGYIHCFALPYKCWLLPARDDGDGCEGGIKWPPR